jgi:1-acyl-sn-glycerol-3-phosphate acyltransferase
MVDVVVPMPVARRSWWGEVLWLPWSITAWTISFVMMVALTILILPIMAFVRFERFQAYPQRVVSWPIWLACSRLKVYVDPAYDPSRVSMFMQNHVSMMDACIACGSISVPFCGLENASHLRVPGYGWLMRCANAIAVDRSKKGFYQDIENAMRERISRGISVLVFPEAHRTLDGQLRPFKPGVFRMARDAGMPIVPISVRGAYRMLPKGTLAVRPSTIEVYIGPQIETEGLHDRDLPALIERVREVHEAWLERREMLGEACQRPLELVPTVEKAS